MEAAHSKRSDGDGMNEQFILVHGVLLCDIHWGIAPDGTGFEERCDLAEASGTCHFVDLYRKHPQAQS